MGSLIECIFFFKKLIHSSTEQEVASSERGTWQRRNKSEACQIEIQRGTPRRVLEFDCNVDRCASYNPSFHHFSKLSGSVSVIVTDWWTGDAMP